ncbi:MAG: PHP domain protein [Candidatus Woesebacteria bacterium GW2011_GWF1_46_13]|uniref:DNA-directed DNA polymerase n=1 Tax=Candidatus Woesebacteria bacterium GW2011_GWF1_46_13 TaxID=1618602 RepID=A0A0G1NN87_9BACT|nr:MAG: PHP domain protein [Candidatus Woesebacteria bacterium GW2011_GWF1_46_13]
MINTQIAELLRAIAAAYQLKNEEKNRFRIIAYQRAADAVEHASSELKDLWDDGKLKEVPGIGESIASHLDELFRTGKSGHFEEVMKGLPREMFDLMEVPGIGAKTAYKLVTKIGIKSLAELEKAGKKGKIAELEGFGEESQSDILRSIEETKGRTKRHILPYAAANAGRVIEWMLKSKVVKRADPLGSLRRQAATVGDIDIAVSSDNSKEALEHFVNYPKKTRVLEKGDRTASIVLPGGVQVDLMVQPPNAYGALLQHFTGSKHHNIALREYALKHGMSLSEYGIKIKGKLNKLANEEEFYKKLGMDWILPELREDAGEIEAALNHKLPRLVELKDVKGDLQIHSDFDIETSHDIGESSMEEIIRKADQLGYEYIAFTEHNPSKSKHNESQVVDILKRKREAVEKLNYSFVKSHCKSIKKVFNSLEIDILPDGGLAIPEKGLALLDFALVSIHSSFRLPRDKMTKRVLSALAYPQVKIFAHPTARKLNEREGVELNWPEIFSFCKKKSKWLEINAEPMRLDLPDILVREAVKTGVKLTLGTDSHHRDGMK